MYVMVCQFKTHHIYIYIYIYIRIQEIYCENYNKLIVGFASIANFYDSELVKNAAFRRRQGLRLLNDVITSFDEVCIHIRI